MQCSNPDIAAGKNPPDEAAFAAGLGSASNCQICAPPPAGGLPGLGRAMALGLAREGHRVLAVGHIAEDVAKIERETAGTAVAERFSTLVADLRRAEARFGPAEILVNNAGLTFTYIDPARYRRPRIQKFWEVGTTSSRTSSPPIISPPTGWRAASPPPWWRGWGRIFNVTTKLDTMNRAGTHPYGAAKAALEMATEVWAKETAGTGLTVNIVNPGAGANTPGMAEEMRAMSRAGTAPRLVEPEEMVPPLLHVVSRAADRVNGWRFDANLWDASLPPEDAAKRAGRPAGFEMHPTR